MFRRSVLIVAFLITTPLLWSAVVDQTATWEEVGIRFLIALPVAAVLVGLVRLASRSPQPAAGETDDDVAGPSAPSSALTDTDSATP